MTTADLIERLATEHGITKDQTKKILDTHLPRSPPRPGPAKT
jgi:hypothetical protein